MTSRERLTRVYRGEPPDRPPVKVWGIGPGVEPIHPSYQPLIDHALAKSDLVVGWGAAGGIFLSATDQVTERYEERPSEHDEFEERVSTFQTPRGPLTRIDLFNRAGKPGYCKKHTIETEEDARRFLSMPYVQARPDCSSFFEFDRELGDRGIPHVGFSHGMYSIDAQMGSETFAWWSVEKRPLLIELIEMMHERCLGHVRHLLDQGVGPFFSYVGPELCIPPLQSMKDFRELCRPYDREITELIHSRGGRVWCHTHGKMGPALEDLIEMGIDVLNPIEPPPMGDLTLAEAKLRVAGRMALEGNIEKGEFYTATPERMRALVREAMAEGAPGGGFILCPTSSFQEWPVCTQTVLDNFRTFVDAGIEFGGAG